MTDIIDQCQNMLAIGHAVVVRKELTAQEWKFHGGSFPLDARWSNGMLFNARCTGACVLSDEVVVFYRAPTAIIRLPVTLDDRVHVFEKLNSYNKGGDV